ncbi:hypothetical protein [Sporomusa acidovorans]|uniref:Uncharacterized protein n=1 Tax=Sporomusa acidovorans (strain ATCC 49682 / DSM 3132 / Mol) TaxID=1123286 RepID=A0ABZ3IYE7_SPOA4|nr:hypothetical protein [Sporomusa acidovorans]OZC16958.1 hypothetical protein SPACI_40050 [Sporomusa acidovorans DSM 3132]SDE13728.1 hypothetical protein SAMN04488499_1008134 [Sporomusa acidovorans]
MCTIIQGIPVMADPALSRKKINQLVCDIIKTWKWEGKELGKIELIYDGQLIHVISYEKPVVQLVPLQINTRET